MFDLDLHNEQAHRQFEIDREKAHTHIERQSIMEEFADIERETKKLEMLLAGHVHSELCTAIDCVL